MPELTRRIVIGISGSSGAVYGIRTMEALKRWSGMEVHLVISEAARRTIALETDWKVEEVTALADVVHSNDDLAAAISSGSFRTAGMLVAPCSMHSLAEIANSSTSSLLTRAADVHLKERRPLVLMVRETPLHIGHLKNMVRAAEIGAVLCPPLPAFYHRPESIDDIINQSVGKALDLLAVPHQLFTRWESPSV